MFLVVDETGAAEGNREGRTLKLHTDKSFVQFGDHTQDLLAEAGQTICHHAANRTLYRYKLIILRDAKKGILDSKAFSSHDTDLLNCKDI